MNGDIEAVRGNTPYGPEQNFDLPYGPEKYSTIRSIRGRTHRLQLSVDDVLKEMNAVNQFKTSMDKSYILLFYPGNQNPTPTKTRRSNR